jgi:hypothetical protein
MDGLANNSFLPLCSIMATENGCNQSSNFWLIALSKKQFGDFCRGGANDEQRLKVVEAGLLQDMRWALGGAKSS